MDLASGLHNLLRDEPDARRRRRWRTAAQLHDVRVPDRALSDRERQARAPGGAASRSAPTARSARCTPRSRWRRRCTRAARKATFRATGQTGILITGGGVPLDAVVADFMAGSIEWLTPDNDPDHWDLIEGQGSLFHASYSGRDAGADPRRPARRADPLPRADAAAHARPARLPAADARGAARPVADHGADREPGGAA